MICGSFERGTTASCSRYAAVSRPTAPAASLRPFHSSARSASSRATLTEIAPRSRQIAAARSAWVSTSARGPSSSISSTAPAPSG